MSSKSQRVLSLDVISARGLVQKTSRLQLHILFRQQLVRSEPIDWVEDDPVFNLNFGLNLQSPGLPEDAQDPTVLIYLTSADGALGDRSMSSCRLL